MKRLILVLLAFALLVPTALAEIAYDGFSGYNIDTFVVFVPDHWIGGSSDGRYLLMSDDDSPDNCVMIANVRHIGTSSLGPEIDANLAYGSYYRLLGMDDLQREEISVNGELAQLWTHFDDDGVTSGFAYYHNGDFLTLFFQNLDPGHESDISIFRDIAAKVVPFDVYYQNE